MEQKLSPLPYKIDMKRGLFAAASIGNVGSRWTWCVKKNGAG